MANTIKQFCPSGHDTFIVGRGTQGRCNQCSRDSVRIRYFSNPEPTKLRTRLYRENNKKQVNEKARLRMLKRRKTDLNYKLTVYLRARLYRAIKNEQKVGSAIRDLGCSINSFKQYMESKFYEGMTWENYGSHWQIDHIKELHTFDLTNPAQFLQAVHYTNLQPLTIKDHKKKTSDVKRIELE